MKTRPAVFKVCRLFLFLNDPFFLDYFVGKTYKKLFPIAIIKILAGLIRLVAVSLVATDEDVPSPEVSKLATFFCSCATRNVR